MQARKAKEATSEINEKLQGTEESYWTVFPVKLTEHILAQIDLSLIQITVRDRELYVLEKHSRIT